jgi:hypothetical protein
MISVLQGYFMFYLTHFTAVLPWLIFDYKYPAIVLISYNRILCTYLAAVNLLHQASLCLGYESNQAEY